MNIDKVNTNPVNINQANIHNLKSLWEKYGSQIINEDGGIGLKTNPHWPHRCWLSNSTPIKDFLWLKHLKKSTILPVWPKINNNGDSQQISTYPATIEKELTDNNWQCVFNQTAMYLSLAEHNVNTIKKSVSPLNKLTIKQVETTEELKMWVDIASQAFGYSIDYLVFKNLIHDKDIKIIHTYYNEQAIATALLYKTGEIIGMHQVGIKPDFQGRGLARSVMLLLIDMAIKWQGTYIVLQASPAGKPLYDNLGFNTQFLIKNYQITLEANSSSTNDD